MTQRSLGNTVFAAPRDWECRKLNFKYFHFMAWDLKIYKHPTYTESQQLRENVPKVNLKCKKATFCFSFCVVSWTWMRKLDNRSQAKGFLLWAFLAVATSSGPPPPPHPFPWLLPLLWGGVSACCSGSLLHRCCCRLDCVLCRPVQLMSAVKKGQVSDSRLAILLKSAEESLDKRAPVSVDRSGGGV